MLELTGIADLQFVNYCHTQVCTAAADYDHELSQVYLRLIPAQGSALHAPLSAWPVIQSKQVQKFNNTYLEDRLQTIHIMIAKCKIDHIVIPS